MDFQPIEDEKGFAWAKSKLEALDNQIRDAESLLASLKEKKDAFSKIIADSGGAQPDSELRSKSEIVVHAVLALIKQRQQHVKSSEILADLEKRGIKLGSEKTRETSALSAIMNYELYKRKPGPRLKSVGRGMFDIVK